MEIEKGKEKIIIIDVRRITKPIQPEELKSNALIVETVSNIFTPDGIPNMTECSAAKKLTIIQ